MGQAMYSGRLFIEAWIIEHGGYFMLHTYSAPEITQQLYRGEMYCKVVCNMIAWL